MEYGENPDQSTWRYTIERTGEAQGNGLIRWTIGLGNCVNFSSVTGASIDGKPCGAITNSEGNGTE